MLLVSGILLEYHRNNFSLILFLYNYRCLLAWWNQNNLNKHILFISKSKIWMFNFLVWTVMNWKAKDLRRRVVMTWHGKVWYQQRSTRSPGGVAHVTVILPGPGRGGFLLLQSSYQAVTDITVTLIRSARQSTQSSSSSLPIVWHVVIVWKRDWVLQKVLDYM